ncbi:MAG: udp, uridine phosphorylase, uridine phosphorylase [Armatimonadetes bacterium CSP1-3]|nr:MAG: udp, uridine phosphorylase, uridine phosphorylase [Armatimonadetes bacterium CSP1-3]
MGTRAWYLRVRPEDVARVVIVVGDPARLQLFKEALSGAEVVGRDREFTTITGAYEGLRLSVAASGIGAPAAAIVLEELAQLGISVVVRAGTMMAFRAKVGDLILAQAACRFEGTSAAYLPPEVPAVPDAGLFLRFREALVASGSNPAVGLVASSDGFYTHLVARADGRMPGAHLLPRLLEWNVLGADMETSAVFTIGQRLGLRTTSLCVATVDGHTGRMLEPAEREEAERRLVAAVLHGLRAAVDER